MSEGFYTYICEECDEVVYSPFHCHSRFCPSCGVSNILKKTDMILSKLVKAPHRHIVFTIPSELRNLFHPDDGTNLYKMDLGLSRRVFSSLFLVPFVLSGFSELPELPELSVLHKVS